MQAVAVTTTSDLMQVKVSTTRITLKPGDVLSLGAFGNLQTPAGASLTVVYEGLPGNPTVSVNIR